MVAVSRLTEPAYQGPALEVDHRLYDAIASAVGPGSLEQTLVVPARDGLAWRVRAGSVVRIASRHGAQVGDLNIWNAHDPRERLWVARTRQLQAAHLSTYDRLWSTLPFLRPLMTIVADSLADYGVDSEGGRVHDTLGTRCDPYVNRMLTGFDFDRHCHSNLVRAVQPFGLTEFDVHDVLNVFQCTGLNAEDKYFMKASPARAMDHLDLFAETDLLMALSACPGGDLSVPLWGEGAHDPVETCRPLTVEIHAVAPSLLTSWQPPSPPDYQGMHGLTSEGLHA